MIYVNKMNIIQTAQRNNNRNNKWTDDEDIKLNNELFIIKNINEIANKHYRDSNEIINRIIKQIINYINENNNIIEKYKNYIKEINEDERKSNIRWTENEDKKLIDEIINNIDITDIIKNHNRISSDIKYRLNILYQLHIIKYEKRIIEYTIILKINKEELYKKIELYKTDNNNEKFKFI